MKTLLLALTFIFSLQSHALTLDPGETTSINGTDVSCGGAETKNNCTLSHCTTYGDRELTAIFMNGKVAVNCVRLNEAISILSDLVAKGICK